MDDRTGKKVKQGSGKTEYYCFVPTALPPQNSPIQYDDELIYLLSEANRFLGRLDEVMR